MESAGFSANPNAIVSLPFRPGIPLRSRGFGFNLGTVCPAGYLGLALPAVPPGQPTGRGQGRLPIPRPLPGFPMLSTPLLVTWLALATPPPSPAPQAAEASASTP